MEQHHDYNKFSLKFKVHDTLGNFVQDNNVLVYVVDPSAPGKAIAAFSLASQNEQEQSTAIPIQGKTHIMNLHLRDYGFEAGKKLFYMAGDVIFGWPMQPIAFVASH